MQVRRAGLGLLIAGFAAVLLIPGTGCDGCGPGPRVRLGLRDASADAPDGADSAPDAPSEEADDAPDAPPDDAPDAPADDAPDGPPDDAPDDAPDAPPDDAPDAASAEVGDGGEAPGCAAARGPCDDCVLWAPATCGADQICAPISDGGRTCARCITAAQTGVRGAPCSKPEQCAPGFACASGSCRAWCAIDTGADGGTSGCPATCASGERCTIDPSVGVAGAGLCFPCDECKPALSTTCGADSTCGIINSGCAACFPAGPGAQGEPCQQHADCRHGLSCISGLCRSSCLTSAAPGAIGSCPSPFQCVKLSPDLADQGTCLPCGECDLFGSACGAGSKCVAFATGCAACLQAGTRPPGSSCVDQTDCQAGLFCWGGVCRAYCTPGATTVPEACGAGFSCLGVRDKPGVGGCLPCGECDVTSGSCRAGLACTQYEGCAVCVGKGTLPAGTHCDSDTVCLSGTCLDGFCRDTCGAADGGACPDGESCVPVTTGGGSTKELCLPCGECDLLAGSGCQLGHKCIVQRATCSICIPAGTSPEGAPCSGSSGCAGALNCANGICRKYCRLTDPASCAGSCALSSLLPAGLGQCLNCGECVPWSPDSCGSASLTCNVYGACAICEGLGGPSGEGQTCSSDQSCTGGLHCVRGLCRALCSVGAPAGGPGTCPANRKCTVDMKAVPYLGAGSCQP